MSQQDVYSGVFSALFPKTQVLSRHKENGSIYRLEHGVSVKVLSHRPLSYLSVGSVKRVSICTLMGLVRDFEALETINVCGGENQIPHFNECQFQDMQSGPLWKGLHRPL